MLEAVTAESVLSSRSPATGSPVITADKGGTAARVRNPRARHATIAPVATAGAAVTAAPAVPSALAAVTAAPVPKRTHVAPTPAADHESASSARQTLALAQGKSASVEEMISILERRRPTVPTQAAAPQRNRINVNERAPEGHSDDDEDEEEAKLSEHTDEEEVEFVGDDDEEEESVGDDDESFA